MAEVFPVGEYDNWLTCQALLPHVQSIPKKKPLQGRVSQQWTSVLKNAAWYTWKQGLLTQAEKLIVDALREREERLGPEELGTLECVSIFGLVLQDQGKYEEAGQMNRRALAAREKKLGEEHPDTLTSVNNLALVLHD